MTDDDDDDDDTYTYKALTIPCTRMLFCERIKPAASV